MDALLQVVTERVLDYISPGAAPAQASTAHIHINMGGPSPAPDVPARGLGACQNAQPLACRPWDEEGALLLPVDVLPPNA
jgi:hypothetical protein